MFATMGYGVYFFFASLMICSMVFVWFLIPETKGVPVSNFFILNSIFPKRGERFGVVQRTVVSVAGIQLKQRLLGSAGLAYVDLELC
jgi:hypothetical protein